MSVIRPSPIPIPRCRSQVLHRRLHSIQLIQRRRRRWNPRSEAEDTAVESTARSPEAAGGKMVVELVGAFNEVTERMNSVWLSTSSSRLLFKALKLSIPILQSLPLASDGRSPLSKALSLSILLADLQMDAEVISASILSEVVEANAISIYEVRDQIGTGTAHLLHEIFRVKNIPFKVDVLDDETAASLRKFYLTYYDIRAVIMDLVSKLDEMRHLDHLPKYRQQILALQVLKIYSPLAHAVGANHLSLELEDISFRYLFPCSYLYLDSWLKGHENGSKPLIDVYKEQLHRSLKADFINTTERNATVSAPTRRPNKHVLMGQRKLKPTKPINQVWKQRSPFSPKPAALPDKIEDKAEVVPPQLCTEKLLQLSNRFSTLDDDCPG